MEMKEFTSAENGDEERHCSRRSARSAIWSSSSLSNLSLNSNIFFFQPNTCISRPCCQNYGIGKDVLIQKILFLTTLQYTFKNSPSTIGIVSVLNLQGSHLEEDTFWLPAPHSIQPIQLISELQYLHYRVDGKQILWRNLKVLYYPDKWVICHLVWVIVTVVSWNVTWCEGRYSGYVYLVALWLGRSRRWPCFVFFLGRSWASSGLSPHVVQLQSQNLIQTFEYMQILKDGAGSKGDRWQHIKWNYLTTSCNWFWFRWWRSAKSCIWWSASGTIKLKYCSSRTWETSAVQNIWVSVGYW